MKKLVALLIIVFITTSCAAAAEEASVPTGTTTVATTVPTTVVATEAPTTTTAPTTVETVTTTLPPVPTTVKPRPVVTSAPAQSSSPGGFLACVRNRESRGNYQALNSSSGASGAYQLMPTTAHNVAIHAGRSDLASKPVSSWSNADQDAMAQVLLQWQGTAPWGGSC